MLVKGKVHLCAYARACMRVYVYERACRREEDGAVCVCVCVCLSLSFRGSKKEGGKYAGARAGLWGVSVCKCV